MKSTQLLTWHVNRRISKSQRTSHWHSHHTIAIMFKVWQKTVNNIDALDASQSNRHTPKWMVPTEANKKSVLR